MKNNKVMKRIIIIVGIILVIIMVASLVYLGTYSRSDPYVDKFLEDGDFVKVTQIDNGYYFDGPGKESAIIFYPGAKVDTKAYAPMLYHLAEQGQDCFLLEMPFHIAFFGSNKATEIIERYDYEEWYISGHSLGGAVAAMYASENADKVDGLILLAAYPTKELADDLKILSIYGDKDGVLNKEKYEEGKQYWTDNTTEVCIVGGNHAQFGNYGKQAKDNDATITAEEQQQQTIVAILELTQ